MAKPLNCVLYGIFALFFLYLLAVIVLFGCRCCKRRILIGHFKDCVRILNENDIKYVLCWGTLLGAVRGGEIIANDDDIDFLIFGEAEKNRAVEALVQALGRKRVRPAHAKRVYARHTTIHADLDFAVLQNGAWVRQDEMSHLGKIDGQKPVETLRIPISMHGEKTFVPVNSHGMLKEFYGETYMTPIDYGKTEGDPRHDFTELKIRRAFKRCGLFI